jgi:pimeloyl-ACP methyl ester carboxylesterase
MPTLAVRKDIVFHYTDSGPVDHDQYSTLVFIHGLAFHSAIFQKLLPIASSHSLRVICPTRRDYPGSSPYTDEEIRIIQHGSHDERTKLLHDQGVLMALCVDGIIQTLSLPKAGGGLAVIGWSMGNIYTLAMRACIRDLPVDTRQRLNSHMRSFIIWDPPFTVFGFTSPHPPPQVSQEEFIATFPKFVGTHYKHVNLDSKDPSQLDQIGDPSRKPTNETMSPEELSSTIDFTPSFKSEVPFLSKSPLVLSNQRTKSLVDSTVRDAWEGIPVWHLVGDSNPGRIQTSPWLLEDTVGSDNVNFELIKNANHFLMWEEPDRLLTVMKQYAFIGSEPNNKLQQGMK